MSATPPYLFDSPPFDAAVSTFRSLLRQQGISDDLRWIWRDAIISRRCPGSRESASRRIFIDGNALAEDDSIRDYYAAGVDRKLGIDLRVFCVAAGVPLCYIHLPEDKTAADYAMMTALKCSIPTPCPTAIFVESRVVAMVLRFIVRVPMNAWLTNEVPRRPNSYARRIEAVIHGTRRGE